MKSKIYLSLIALFSLALASCKSYGDHLAYFKDMTEAGSGTIQASDKPITLKPEDELRITVTALSPAAVAPFNIAPITPIEKGDVAIDSSVQFMTYIVNRDGDIDFPTLGKIHVEGMTTKELKEELTRRISESVKDPMVTVTLLNFRVKVMGEVSRPGLVSAKTEHFTVLDALASAGDLTQYSRRDNILVIRQNDDGTQSYQTLDLRDSRIFDSPYFVMKQNDMIYVTPNEIKESNSSYNTNNGYRLSVISTVVSASSVVATLVIALTRR